MATPCPVTKYAEDVLSGKEVACKLVKLACQRHLNDQREGGKRGLVWSTDHAQHIIDFFQKRLKLYDGRFAGQPFLLRPFQQFLVGCLFGWLQEDGSRRFRQAYIEAAKGCGKSPLAAGIGLYGLTADRERGAEIYSAATSLSQARILFRDAIEMASASPTLAAKLNIQKLNIAYEAKASFFRPVARDHKAQSGPRPHFNLIDEVHEHPDGELIRKMKAGHKGRTQPLTFEITNAGCDRETVCWEHHEYTVKILEGVLENDQWFGCIFTLDPCAKCWSDGWRQPNDGCDDCDDWHDEAVWEKANPGLGYINSWESIREQVKLTAGMPAEEGIVKRLHFTIWTESATRAIPMDCWDACKTTVDIPSLQGMECYAGLDIGATSDFTALTLLFPHDDVEFVEIPVDPTDPEKGMRTVSRRSYTMVPHFWLPDRPRRRDERMESLINLWRRQGHIRTTPGDTVDYDQVVDDIAAIVEPYGLRRLTFDRGFQGVWVGTRLLQHFGEHVVQFILPGLTSMGPAFREFLELLLNGRLHHNGNPVMTWMASNCAAVTRNGLSRPSKEHSGEKIDGIVSACMALAGASMDPPVPSCRVESW